MSADAVFATLAALTDIAERNSTLSLVEKVDAPFRTSPSIRTALAVRLTVRLRAIRLATN